jgi:signal transduction histidine kinase
VTARRVFGLRSSVLLKSIAAVLLALAASTLVTSVATSRMTRSALDKHSRELGLGQVSILREAYKARDRQLVINLRNLVQILVAQGLFSPGRQFDLIAELGRASANLDLKILTAVDGQGRPLSPPAAVGLELANPNAVPRADADGLRSRLVRATDGTFVQVTASAISNGSDEFLLIGGYAFDDEFAFNLRKQIGSLDDVVLVASGQVVGSTLPLPPRRPPTPAGQEELPTSPAKVDRSDFHGVVSYVQLGQLGDLEHGAIGLVLNGPPSPLAGTLARARLAVTIVLAVVTLGLGVLLYRHLIRPLVRLAGTAQRIAEGDLDATFDASGRDEIGMLAASLEQMRVELRAKLDLVASQAEHLQRQARALQRQARDLQESSQRIVAAEDNERHRLARDLHDGIQQELVVLRMRVGMAADAPAPASNGERALEFEQLGADLDATIAHLREVTGNLYPSILLDRGLAVATRSYLRGLPRNVQFSYASEPFPRLDPAVESGAYFLLCEALTNAFKHSNAPNISVSLDVAGDRLNVCVRDDGDGFTPEGVRGRSGLLHMHDRVRSFGGELEIVSAPAEGTSITARFPTRLPDDTDAALPDPLVATDRSDREVSPLPAPERTGLRRPAG